MFQALKDRFSKDDAAKAERKARKEERARKKAEVDARRREHKLRHGGSGAGGH
jgi:hypothetical protein